MLIHAVSLTSTHELLTHDPQAAEMQEDLSALPRYYLYGEGGSLKAALVSDGFVDVDQVGGVRCSQQ